MLRRLFYYLGAIVVGLVIFVGSVIGFSILGGQGPGPSPNAKAVVSEQTPG